MLKEYEEKNIFWGEGRGEGGGDWGEEMQMGGGLGRDFFFFFFFLRKKEKNDTRQVWAQQNKEIKWTLRKY